MKIIPPSDIHFLSVDRFGLARQLWLPNYEGFARQWHHSGRPILVQPTFFAGIAPNPIQR